MRHLRPTRPLAETRRSSSGKTGHRPTENTTGGEEAFSALTARSLPVSCLPLLLAGWEFLANRRGADRIQNIL